MIPTRFSVAIVVLLALSAASCGGGSGGGGGTAPPRPPPSGSQQPSAPTISYNGRRAVAIIDRSNATYFASQVVALKSLYELAESLWIEAPAQPDDFTTTINGSGGGTATITGTFVAVDIGWLVIDYRQFTEKGVTFDGRSIQRYRSKAGLSPGNGSTIYFENSAFDFSLVRVLGGDRPAISVQGTINDSVLGSVQVTSIAPFPDFQGVLSGEAVIAIRGGRVQLNSDGMLAELRSLSRSHAGLMLDTDGDLTFDSGKRLTWAELIGESAGGNSVMAGPIANAGEDIFADTGTEVTLHGLYSHDDDGDWLSFQWRLLFKPFGSQVQLPNPTSPEIAFTPDVDGDYLIALRVSDGVDTRESTTMVRSEFVPLNPVPASTRFGGLEVAEPFQVGVPIMVDGRSATNRLFDDVQPRYFQQTARGGPQTNPSFPHPRVRGCDSGRHIGRN